MKEIVPGLYYFTGMLVGRVYAIEDPDGLTLIDTALPISPAKIIKQVKATGRDAKDIKRIILTHAHPDHIGGLPKLKELTNASIIASEQERQVIEFGQPIPRADRQQLKGISRFLLPPVTRIKDSVVVDRVVKDGDVLEDVMGGLHVIATPGHAPGHLSFWQPQRRILFTGDTIFRMREKMTLPYSFLTVDMASNRQSIGKLAALEPAVICFGHGNPITQQAPALLHEFAKNL